jgi:hypothetical protein
MNNDMHEVEPLTEVIETVLYTANLPNTTPVSIILVGQSGSGKSKLLSSYRSDRIHLTDSVTSSGLFKLMQDDKENKIRFICMPDINPTMMRKASTVGATVGNLLSLTGDGTIRCDDGREVKEMKHAVIGLLTACTPEIYDKHAKQWFALGLRRRIIPIFYKYGFQTIHALQAKVRKGIITSRPAVPKLVELGNFQYVPVINKVTAEGIQQFSSDFANNLGKLSYFAKEIKQWTIRPMIPISPHVILRSLAMAHAMRRKSKVTSEIDMKFLLRFIRFTDPESPVEI